jgi:cold-inducible RNA-binding protein
MRQRCFQIVMSLFAPNCIHLCVCTFFNSQRPGRNLNTEKKNKMKLYVGNLSFQTTEQDLNALFAAHGTVTETNMIMDRETGRPRGFGFVTMSSADEGNRAIEALHGKNIDGRDLTVNEAKPMEARGPRREFSGGSGGRGGSGGGNRNRY